MLKLLQRVSKGPHILLLEAQGGNQAQIIEGMSVQIVLHCDQHGIPSYFLLLCDEPTGALDYNTGKAVLKLLQRTCRDMGKTVIVITHNQALIAVHHALIASCRQMPLHQLYRV